MEELQDAIEDAQYINAVANTDEGPRPILHWDDPTEEEMYQFKASVKAKAPDAFAMEWTLNEPLGLFIFSAHLKDTCRDYAQINIVEDIQRWRNAGSSKAEMSRRILERYVLPLELRPQLPAKDDPEAGQTTTEAEDSTGTTSLAKTEIDEHDLKVRPLPNGTVSSDDRNASLDPTCSRNCIGIAGPVLEEILNAVMEPLEEEAGDSEPRSLSESKILNLPATFFDRAEAVVLSNIKDKYWESFEGSEEHTKLLKFLWYQNRPVVEEDFFTMRVLGRGGFGLVNACKKGTTGKLYALKVMNKKRIKIKKSETLILNEKKALARVNSPFVVNLIYSFHSKTDVFLILDLLTGGDLSFHLMQRRRFPKEEAQYYAARVMLGLQALHDRNYVYRDLKPENCLMAEDGRVKLTDLGLATKVHPKLHGAAGTRGYWAPEMLKRDENGKRMIYGKSVDWFSFGCLLAEMLCGFNPYRSEAALKFGQGKGKEKKEEAIDLATLEMDPELDLQYFDDNSADLVRKLLDKDPTTRLGCGENGCKDIMDHSWFDGCDWEAIITDKMVPPFVPRRDVNASSQSDIGTFTEDKKFHQTVLEEKDEKIYGDWAWTNKAAFQAEVIEFLIYERETGEPLVPMDNGSECCCAVS